MGAYQVDFKQVTVSGLENAVVPEALAGLRANEARYFWNKYKFVYETFPADEKDELVNLINRVLLEERQLVFESPILEVALYEDENLFWPEFYYQNGMVINMLYEKHALVEGKQPKRAVGIKLSEGMAVPVELVDKFKFARQKSKLAGEIRGSFFVLKQEWV